MNDKKKLKLISVILIFIWVAGILQSGRLLPRLENENYYRYRREELKQSETQETFLVRNVTLRSGTYNVSFEYTAASDMNLQVISIAGYDLESDSFEIFHEESITAGENRHFETSFDLEKETMMVSVIINSLSENIPQISALTIENIHQCYTDAYIYCLLYIMAITVITGMMLYFIWSKKVSDKFYKISIFIGMVIICIFANSLYFTEATPNGHDIAFHMRRVEGLALSLSAGEIPQRMNTVFNAGYGYLNSVMYPELFLYMPAALVCFGMSTLGAMKVFYIIFNIATVFIAYYSFKKLSGNEVIGFCLSVVYVLSFYRMENVYLRGAMGESLFMAFLPLAVYALYTIMQTERKRWILFALSVSAIIQSHILGSLFTVIFLGCEFVIFSIDLLAKNKFDFKIIVECIKAVIFTVLLNFWFIVPFLYYYITQKFMMFDKVVQLEKFFQQLIPLKSMMSLSIVQTNIIENMGILVMGAAVFSIMLYVISILCKKENILLLTMLMLLILLFGAACTDVFPWEALSNISLVYTFITTIQFAFRFYGVFICAICLFICIATRKIPKGKGLYVLLPFVIVISAVSTYDFFENGQMNKSNGRYYDYYYDAPNEYLMDGADLAKEIANPQKVKASENIIITEYSKDRDNITLSLEKIGDDEGYIKLPLFYYYGYEAIADNGEKVNLVSGENSCLTCVVANNNIKTINVSFKNDRKIFRYPQIVSVLFIIVCIGYYVYDKVKRTRKSRRAY